MGLLFLRGQTMKGVSGDFLRPPNLLFFPRLLGLLSLAAFLAAASGGLSRLRGLPFFGMPCSK